MEVFVLVACPQTALLDSREFLAPIITVFEAELAFTPGLAWQPGAYRTGFSDTAPPESSERVRAADVSRDSDASGAALSSSTQLTVRLPLQWWWHSVQGTHVARSLGRCNLDGPCKAELPGVTWPR